MQYPPDNNPQPPDNQPPFQQYPPQQWQQPNTQYPQQPNTQYSSQGQWQQPPVYQPPPQPPKKKSRLGLIIAIVAGVLVLACIIAGIAAVAGSKSTNTGTSVSTNNTPSTTATIAPTTNTSTQHFQVGQTVKVGDTWQITLDSAKTDNGGQFNALKSGDEYLNLSITAKNISSQEQNISSALQFTLTDITGQKYDETIDPNAGATLDGKIEAGSQLKGNIAYEVPKSVHSYQMAFEASIVSSGQTIWDVKV